MAFRAIIFAIPSAHPRHELSRRSCRSQCVFRPGCTPPNRRHPCAPSVSATPCGTARSGSRTPSRGGPGGSRRAGRRWRRRCCPATPGRPPASSGRTSTAASRSRAAFSASRADSASPWATSATPFACSARCHSDAITTPNPAAATSPTAVPTSTSCTRRRFRRSLPRTVSSSACRARSSAACRRPETAFATSPAFAGRSAGFGLRHPCTGRRGPGPPAGVEPGEALATSPGSFHPRCLGRRADER